MSKYPNSGSFSSNDRKEKASHADLTGSCEITCPSCQVTTNWWVNIWNKAANASGGPWYSLSLREKQNPRPAGVPEREMGQGRQWQDAPPPPMPAPPAFTQQAPLYDEAGRNAFTPGGTAPIGISSDPKTGLTYQMTEAEARQRGWTWTSNNPLDGPPPI